MLKNPWLVRPHDRREGEFMVINRALSTVRLTEEPAKRRSFTANVALAKELNGQYARIGSGFETAGIREEV